MGTSLKVEDLHAYYGQAHILRGISMAFQPGKVTAIIGPSGCGKSTLVRCLNRMHEVVHGARVEGKVILDSENIYDPQVDPVEIRHSIGMVFQKPNPFPGLSVFENVAAGLRLNSYGQREIKESAERSLKMAALWDEVKDRLNSPGTSLSGGQQQRLCIARALAVEPDILLMDEPCSALDPAATLRIEDLIRNLKGRYTVVIVTHNMQQAARVADHTAFLLNGELVEYGVTDQIFTLPKDKRTEDYITGRFG